MADFVAEFLVASQFKPCRANNRDTELFWLVFVAAMEETGSNGAIPGCRYNRRYAVESWLSIGLYGEQYANRTTG